MAESDRRNPSASTPTRIDGAAAPQAPYTRSTTPDSKLRLVERLTDDVGVIISRQYVLNTEHKVADQHGNLLVVTTGGRDDTILIDQRQDGTLDVSVNDKHYALTLDVGQELAVRSGGGNDKVIATSRVTANMVVDTGAGKDIAITGQGNDFVDSGADNDILFTRDGKDYGLGNTGNDYLNLGRGTDVGRGGSGDDRILGGGDKDFLDGGKGKNLLHGGSDKDLLFGSRDLDQLRGGKADRIYNRDGIDPSLGSSIKVIGRASFRERVHDDLDLLRSSPVGRQFLTELDRIARDKGHSVTIKELTYEQNGFAAGPNDSVPGEALLKNTPDGVVAGAGTSSTITFNPSFFNPAGYDDGFLPVVVLYHELSHAYNIMTGTLQTGIYAGPGLDIRINNGERQAVGLRNSGYPYDFDGDPSTPKTTANPTPLTENAFRKEAGLNARMTYSQPLAQPNRGAGSTEPESATEKLVNRIDRAIRAKDPAALQEALTALTKSVDAEKFREEGASELDRQEAKTTNKIKEGLTEAGTQAAQATSRDFSGAEESAKTPKFQQSIRMR